MRLLPLFLAALPFSALAEAPKLGPNATFIGPDDAYLRAASPDFWAFWPFVKPQFTTSACSIASVTAALNGLRGVPALASDAIPTQPQVLEKVADPDWTRLSAEGGDGVTFAQLVTFTEKALAAYGMRQKATAWKPADTSEPTLTTLRNQLAENENSASDVMLVYFNQGVVTGDWDGPHVALIGSYDAAQDRVIILEVDQEWYIPYWTPVPVLLDAMLKPAPAEQGVLAGETGGLVWIR